LLLCNTAGIFVLFDQVINHVGYGDFAEYYPFNKTEDFHDCNGECNKRSKTLDRHDEQQHCYSKYVSCLQLTRCNTQTYLELPHVKPPAYACQQAATLSAACGTQLDALAVHTAAIPLSTANCLGCQTLIIRVRLKAAAGMRRNMRNTRSAAGVTSRVGRAE